MTFKEKAPTPMPEEGRTSHHTYTPEETDLIVRVWTEETNDAIRGVDQKGEAYWQRILDRMNPLIGANLKHRQIKGHWARVNAEVKLWENIWVETCAKWPFGHSADMLQQKAQTIFAARSTSGPFTYWNAWKMLQTNRRFKSMYIEGDVHASKRTKTSEMGDFTTSGSGEEITSSRPIGNKAARAVKGKGKSSALQASEAPPETKEMFEKFDNKITRIMEMYDQKNALKREIHDDRVIFMKTSDMTPEQLEWHKEWVTEILARRKGGRD
ncbi:uncharacterized protein LOC131023404 [Salvia miltiorrhiza]|uniref:uncharacterized protein LOC131023404 n=1 Tax=Salvia miltiorrhiza TaxID=226208 RepID=UPI0025AD725F|nr:uncharacterized protein LOC131023404 [Salvia miltiorrhiza]